MATSIIATGEMPSHKHNARLFYGGWNGWDVITVDKYVFKWGSELFYNDNSQPYTGNISYGHCIMENNVGGSQAHNSLIPHYAVFVYKRIQ